MKPTWIVQTNCFVDYDIDSLISAIKRQGNDVKYGNFTIRDRHLLDDIPQLSIIYGSVQFCNIASKAGAYPGYYYRSDTFSMSAILANWADMMINSESLFVPWGEVKRRYSYFFDTFDGSFFMRPNLSSKSFTGFVINQDNWEIERSTIDSQNVMVDEMVMIAPAKKITHEWRFFVSDRIICSTPYGWDDNLIDVPEEATKFVENILRRQWQPDSAYVVDIGQTETEMGIIEINSVNSSGLYKCNVDDFVQGMNDLVSMELDYSS
ncbi:MAG: ATP-grasp domain-containing protein [Candidimonas sp.]